MGGQCVQIVILFLNENMLTKNIKVTYRLLYKINIYLPVINMDLSHG